MKNLMKKIILIVMPILCCSTLLLDWRDISGVHTVNGTVVLSGNIMLSALIFGLYFISVMFFERRSRVFFCTGLASLSMLFALMLAKFEAWGRFANSCAGPHAGLSAVLATIVVYVLMLRGALCAEER